VADENRRIYTDTYEPALLQRRPETAYDRTMIETRDALLRAHGSGRDVLDLCCGTGEYACVVAPLASRTIGLDFSHTMLRALRDRPDAAAVAVAEADARALPLDDASVDVVASFASLYYVPDVAAVLSEIARVLRSGGVAMLELGNTWSLNTVVVRSQSRYAGWAEPHHISYASMRRAVRDAGLEVESWRAFQLLPMFGAPRRLAPLAPLLSARWKPLLGRQVRGRMLDEVVSSARPFRYLAFRHLVVARKP
jgi:ubiquinone/menaquinone biosynthesis C-methylase UbiE